MPATRSLTVKLPSSEARISTSLVFPAAPFPPMPLPSMAEISPDTNVPWPTRSATVARLLRMS